MHNNFYFLRQASRVLTEAIMGYRVVSCFTQSKEELILEFNNSKKSFFIKASLQSGFCCLSFPNNFDRARKNSVDLFPSIILKKIVAIRQYENERSFSFALESDLLLLFKMHGSRANVVLFENNKAIEIFRNQFKADFTINPGGLDKIINPSKDFFLHHLETLRQEYFTFGKDVWSYLDEMGFEGLDDDSRWELFSKTVKKLTDPEYYILEKKGEVIFSLLPAERILYRFVEPLEAVTKFHAEYQVAHGFNTEKSTTLRALESQWVAGKNFIEKNIQKLNETGAGLQYQQWGDLIMAHLDRVKPGMEKIILENFYDEGKPMEIRLNKAMNGQTNAAVFYRKAKNRQIEIQKLKKAMETKEMEIKKLQIQIANIEKETDLHGLRGIVAPAEISRKEKETKRALPYHEFEYKGFKIWVGKNADHNDELTSRFSHKEDLWLHAKDVAGSHVLLKYQAGKNFPKDVIERAAELAAYNSKRKNDSLCPVTVTPRKFVRKRKGDPAGAVVVEKEKVILVTPRL